jgi:HSP20 family protein
MSSVGLRVNELRISGACSGRESTGVPRRRTRGVGRFEYVVAVPDELDPDEVEATSSDGPLIARVGKAVASRPRRIEVKGS